MLCVDSSRLCMSGLSLCDLCLCYSILGSLFSNKYLLTYLLTSDLDLERSRQTLSVGCHVDEDDDDVNRFAVGADVQKATVLRRSWWRCGLRAVSVPTVYARPSSSTGGYAISRRNSTSTGDVERSWRVSSVSTTTTTRSPQRTDVEPARRTCTPVTSTWMSGAGCACSTHRLTRAFPYRLHLHSTSRRRRRLNTRWMVTRHRPWPQLRLRNSR